MRRKTGDTLQNIISKFNPTRYSSAELDSHYPKKTPAAEHMLSLNNHFSYDLPRIILEQGLRINLLLSQSKNVHYFLMKRGGKAIGRSCFFSEARWGYKSS